MRPVRLTARLATIVLVVVAFYVRPISIAFAIGGFLLGLGIRYATAHWSQVAPILKRVLITFVVGGLGLFPIVATARYKPSVVTVAVILVVGWILLPAKIRVRARFYAIVGLVSIWLGTVYTTLSVRYSLRQPLEPTRYSVRVDQSDEGKTWAVRSEALFNLPNPPTELRLTPELMGSVAALKGSRFTRDKESVPGKYQVRLKS
jgi:hypothetical protein